MYIIAIYLDVHILHMVLLKCNVTFTQAMSDQKITKGHGTRPVSECSSH